MRKVIAGLFVALGLCLIGGVGWACSVSSDFIPPTNYELIKHADGVVLARAMDETSGGSRRLGEVRFEVLEVIGGKGLSAGDSVHGSGTLVEIADLLERSVQHALANREKSIEYAMRFGRGIDRKVADRFVELYVNRLTVDAGPAGLEAVQRLFREASDRGLVPAAADVVFIRG